MAIRFLPRTLAALLVGLLLTGCFREVARDPQSLVRDADEDIVVATKDGFRYSFSERDYVATVDTFGNQVIMGKGRQYRLNSSQYTRFEGSVAFNTIEKITVSETTPLLYMSIGAVVIFAGLAIWLSPFKVG